MKTLLRITLAASLLVAAACSQPAGSITAADLKTEDDKTLYALGTLLARNAETFELTPDEAKIVAQGFGDSVSKRELAVSSEAYGPKVMMLSRTRMTARADKEKVAATGFLAEAEKESGAEKTATGLIFKTLTPGKGENPKPTDMVKVHYKGTLRDGTEFDSSYKRGQPAEFSLGGVVPCWTEGLQKMKVGGKAQLTCPSAIAYGDRGSPPTIPGGAALRFEVELLEAKPAPAMPMIPGHGSAATH